MSNAFSAAELGAMQAAQDAHLMDVCQIGVYVRVSSDYGEPIETWSYGQEYACGLEQRPGLETRRDTMTTTRYDAVLRLPVTVDIDVKDRIRITKRYGASIVPLEYNIASPVQRGASGIRLLLEATSP